MSDSQRGWSVNLDFSGQPLFSWYVVFLLVSGVLMVGLGLIGNGLSNGWRAVNVIFGLGFLGYGIYLGFIFQGGTYMIFFKVFILPVALIVRSIAAMNGRKRAAAAQPVVQAQQAAFQQGAYQQYPQPVGYQPQDQPNPYQQVVPQGHPNPYQAPPVPQAPPMPYDPNR
ncbi:hypothetical protein ACFYNO_39515 [Kitasatospora sp. NPDC006697]|uniref:hypothetical protein n=1 Tax=Kitasatospora sp. NPDC006697 TaxID=3364020 RepID=UPI0036B9CB7A